MRQESGEMLQNPAVQNDLCLVVGSRDDISNGSQGSSLQNSTVVIDNLPTP